MFPSEIEEVQRKDKKSVLTSHRLIDIFYINFDGRSQRVKRVISNQYDDGSPKIRIRAGSVGALKRGGSAEEAK